jgi:multidrug efflux pump subunit AcrA (membrane-fusion protein)
MEGSIANRATLRAAEPLPGRRSVWRAIARALAMTLLAVGVLAAGVAGFRWLVATRPPPVVQAVTERPRPVETVTVAPGTITPELRLFGTIVSGRSVDLRALVAGEIVAIAPGLREGGRVEAGEMLVEIDAFEYRGALVRARAELAEAEARVAETVARIRLESDAGERAREQMAIAERELQRLQTLAQRESATEAQLDASRNRLSLARGGVESRANQARVLEAQLARERAALDRFRFAVEKAERDLSATRLAAPFAGIVANAAAERGRLTTQQDRVATLSDPTRFEARFTLSDAVYGRLLAAEGRLEGREVRVIWRGGGNGATLERRAVIERVAPTVTAATAGFEVFARILEADAARLRPGAFVEIAKSDRPFANVVSVPQSALHPGERVFLVGPDNRLIAVPVAIAGYDGDAVLLSGDFPANARVVTTRLTDGGPGLLVEPRQ